MGREGWVVTLDVARTPRDAGLLLRASWVVRLKLDTRIPPGEGSFSCGEGLWAARAAER